MVALSLPQSHIAIFISLIQKGSAAATGEQRRRRLERQQARSKGSAEGLGWSNRGLVEECRRAVLVALQQLEIGAFFMANQEAKNQQSSSLDEPPLWDYVSKIEKQGGGGNWKFKCNVCNEIQQGSYSRVRARLLGIKGSGISICKKATLGDKLEMKRLEDEYEEKKAESKSKEVELPCESGVGFKKRKGLLMVITSYFRELLMVENIPECLSYAPRLPKTSK
ncbi:hypothetical protein E3N88_39846 [Mikania micrantha]|uniref:BED-type domain-containing protein n=1 Tax=Mikania micrantha TaxID=192012 RepID=A0A5N6LKY0_9ASTR|nr:hypothetical protein E3N88_39846 [Mikania micrantha]